jgi:hypothetical protein
MDEIEEMQEWVGKVFAEAREETPEKAIFVAAMHPTLNRIVGRVWGITSAEHGIEPEDTWALRTDFQRGGEVCATISGSVWGAATPGRVIVSAWEPNGEPYRHTEFSVPNNPRDPDDASVTWLFNEMVLLGSLFPIGEPATAAVAG